MVETLAELANRADATKAATALLTAYWAKHDPDGARRARWTSDPVSKATSSRAHAAKLDAEWRARQTKGKGLE